MRRIFNLLMKVYLSSHGAMLGWSMRILNESRWLKVRLETGDWRLVRVSLISGLPDNKKVHWASPGLAGMSEVHWPSPSPDLGVAGWLVACRTGLWERQDGLN